MFLSLPCQVFAAPGGALFVVLCAPSCYSTSEIEPLHDELEDFDHPFDGSSRAEQGKPQKNDIDPQD